MGELRASVDGCEVVVELDEGTELSPDLRTALADLAETMYAERAAQAEVAGFGLRVGDMGLGLDPMGPTVSGAHSCWGYSGKGGGSCSWYSNDEGDGDPDSCTVYSQRKKK